MVGLGTWREAWNGACPGLDKAGRGDRRGSCVSFPPRSISKDQATAEWDGWLKEGVRRMRLGHGSPFSQNAVKSSIFPMANKGESDPQSVHGGTSLARTLFRLTDRIVRSLNAPGYHADGGGLICRFPGAARAAESTATHCAIARATMGPRLRALRTAG